jgi:predicted RNA-binding protein YlxR (DUF448 family)
VRRALVDHTASETERRARPDAASVRTCIGCRRRAPAADLVRIVVDGTRLVFGRRGGRPGRGASLHPRRECLAAAVARRALPRAFKRPVDEPRAVDGDAAGEALVHQIEVAFSNQQPRSG